MGPRPMYSGAAVILSAFLASFLAACSSASDDTTPPAALDTSVSGAPLLDAFVSDAPLLADLEPDFKRTELLDRGEFTLLGTEDGDKILAEVVVLDTDDQPMHATPTGDDEQLSDGTPVAVRQAADPAETLSIEYPSDTGASVRVSAFDSNIFELLFIADTADISADGSLTIGSDDYTIVADARLPFYTGGVRTSYSIGVDGEEGRVNITSFARRGGELDVFDFGPHDPATVNSRDVLFQDQGAGNGSYVFEWDNDTMIEVAVYLLPGTATPDDVAAIIDGLRTTDVQPDT